MLKNYKTLNIQIIFLFIAFVSSFFIQNHYILSFTIFMTLSIAWRVFTTFSDTKENIPKLLTHKMILNFFKPLLFVLLNFLLFHSLEKEDLAISLAIIDIGAIVWFFHYSQIQKNIFPFFFTIYVFCSIFLTPIFYFLDFLVADIHFKVKVSFDTFNQILFLFMVISMLLRAVLNYNMLTQKVPKSIYHILYFLWLEPFILIMVNWLFYPIANEYSTFFEHAIYWTFPYILPIISFIYLIKSSYIKQLYFLSNNNIEHIN